MKKKTVTEPEIVDKEIVNNETEEWKEKYLRVLADYQNLERRTRDEKEEARKFASEILLGRLFSAIDTLGKAKEYLKDAGLDLAYKEFLAVLQEQGVERIETQDQEFNPHEMECIEVVQGKDNIVVEEVFAGYRLYGKILRVAQVKVGKKSN